MLAQHFPEGSPPQKQRKRCRHYSYTRPIIDIQTYALVLILTYHKILSYVFQYVKFFCKVSSLIHRATPYIRLLFFSLRISFNFLRPMQNKHKYYYTISSIVVFFSHFPFTRTIAVPLIESFFPLLLCSRFDLPSLLFINMLIKTSHVQISAKVGYINFGEKFRQFYKNLQT